MSACIADSPPMSPPGGERAAAPPERHDDRGALPPGRRFADVLARRGADERRLPQAPPSDEALRCAARACALREPVPAPGAVAAPAPHAVAPAADVGLADVQVATGADGSLLRFRIEDGSLAGTHMAFLLRGDVLDVTLEAAGAWSPERRRGLEGAVREALAARGLELDRFDADGGAGHRDEDRDEPGGTPPPARRRHGGRGGAE